MKQNLNAPLNDAGNSNSQEEDDFKYLAEVLPQIVWTSDPEGTIGYISPQFGHFSGLSNDDPEYLDWLQLVPEEDRGTVMLRWQNSLETGDVYDQEMRMKGADGQFYWFSARAVPVRAIDGTIIKWYGTTTNIDALKRAQGALQRTAAEKGKFIAMLGHELRNPLSALACSYNNLVHDRLPNSERQTVLDSLGRQIEHLSRMVADTLDISRLSSGKIKLVSTKFDLNEMVKACGRDIQNRFAINSIGFHVQSFEGPVWVEGDIVRLSQCVNNLLNNSMKFTASGGKVRLSCGQCPDTGMAEICVTDDGIGMSEEEMTSVFKPFSQGRNAAQLSREGLGLGLAITQEIVEMHKGGIKAESPGKQMGATFTLHLPKIEEPNQSPAEPEFDQAEKMPCLKILLVDDDEGVASMLELFLQLEGHSVTVAGCGRTAFAALDAELPDIVFCDLSLPGSIKGWDIAKRVKTFYISERLPYLVALSGHSDAFHVGKCMESGFDEHISKPPSLEQLRSALKKANRSL